MKNYELVLQFKTSKNIAKVAALARLLDFPSGDDDIYDDYILWEEEVFPALDELFILISHYLDDNACPERLMSDMVNGTTDKAREVIKQITHTAKNMSNLCDEWDSQRQKTDDAA